MPNDKAIKPISRVSGIKVPESSDPYQTIQSYLGRLFEQNPDIVKLIRKSSSFFVKPNRVDYFMDNAELTDLRLIEAVIVKIRENNPQAKIYLGERPMAARCDSEVDIITKPLQNICSNYDIEFVDPIKAQRTPITIEELSFSFPKKFLESDLIINLPKLKTHHQAGWSGAMKNFMGLLLAGEMGRLHLMGIHHSIAVMNRTLEDYKIISIMDMVEAQEEWGPHCGKKRFLGLLLMSMDAYAEDHTAVKLTGHTPEEFPYFWEAARYLGKDNLEIEYAGPEIIPDKPFTLSPAWGFDVDGDYTIAANTALNLATGNFDIECRIYLIHKDDIQMGGRKEHIETLQFSIPYNPEKQDTPTQVELESFYQAINFEAIENIKRMIKAGNIKNDHN